MHRRTAVPTPGSLAAALGRVLHAWFAAVLGAVRPRLAAIPAAVRPRLAGIAGTLRPRLSRIPAAARPRHAVIAILVLALVGGALAVVGQHRGHTSAEGTWVGSGGKQLRVAPPAVSSSGPAAPAPATPTPASPAPATPAPAAPAPAAPATPEPTVPEPQVTAPAGADFFGWTLLDRRTGTFTGSANMATGTNSTESMIKVWIVSDYLRRLPAGAKPDDATLGELAAAIVHSDDNAAEKYYRAGGGDTVVQRMISTCGLTNTTLNSGWWSRTQMSPLDAAKLGICVADGRAAGPTWTSWVLGQMRSVQGSVADQQETTGGGHWGIIDGLPASLATGLAIKNGWTPISSDGDWHVNNLAISDDWVLTVMVRYPIANGLGYGADVCSAVAKQLLPTLEA